MSVELFKRKYLNKMPNGDWELELKSKFVISDLFIESSSSKKLKHVFYTTLRDIKEKNSLAIDRAMNELMK